MTKIACIGEVMIELSLQTTETAQIGIAGDTYNTAVYLAHLLQGRAEVHYVTALGQDAFSDRILAHMQIWDMVGAKSRGREMSCRPYTHTYMDMYE